MKKLTMRKPGRPKVRRFYYVGTASERGKIHRCERLIEGSLMFCGSPIRLGWHYWVRLDRVPRNRALCAKCV